MTTIFVHIVTYRSGACVFACLEKLLSRKVPELDTVVLVTENGSDPTVIDEIRQRFGDAVQLRYNAANLGFAGAHNQGAADFLRSSADLLFILNPDVVIDPEALKTLADALQGSDQAVMATPLLLRPKNGDTQLIDAAGMELLPSLRHLDRDSEAPFIHQYASRERVFGGTGAALLMTRQGVEALQLRGERFDSDVTRLFPQLGSELSNRHPLFDEAYFAYREDADLAWRAQNLGFHCLFVPDVVAEHTRRVTPERRESLPPEINRHSVRNRFLLQINNFFPTVFPQAILPGLIVRNVLVLAGIVLRERSSLPALREVAQLFRRQWERRQILQQRMNGRKSV